MASKRAVAAETEATRGAVPRPYVVDHGFYAHGKVDKVYSYMDDTREDNLAFGLTMNDAKNTENVYTAAGCVLSIFNNCWSGMKDVVKEVCDYQGIQLVPVKVPSQMNNIGVRGIIIKYKRTEIMIYNGYFILLLFENFSSDNYTTVFDKRIAEMKALVGIPKAAAIVPVFKPRIAEDVKTLISYSCNFRRQIIECLQNEENGGKDFGNLANFILKTIR